MKKQRIQWKILFEVELFDNAKLFGFYDGAMKTKQTSQKIN